MLVKERCEREVESTYVFLLLVHVTNLEPNVFFAKRLRRVGDNVAEAL